VSAAGMADITPEMLTLASIVSVKIQSCVTRYEDEGKKKKKCVVASPHDGAG
jgi:hypothetical protein